MTAQTPDYALYTEPAERGFTAIRQKIPFNSHTLVATVYDCKADDYVKMINSHSAAIEALKAALPVLRSAVSNAEPSSNCWATLKTDSAEVKQSKADTIAAYNRAKERLSKAVEALKLAGVA